MSYIRLVLELVNLYDPDSSEFDLTEETMEMSDSDKPECCQQAAEITDERQQDTEENQSLSYMRVRWLGDIQKKIKSSWKITKRPGFMWIAWELQQPMRR